MKRLSPSEHPLRIAVLIATLDSLAFVVTFLSLAERDDDFDKPPAGEQLGRHDGHALLLGSHKMFDLASAGQQLTD